MWHALARLLGLGTTPGTGGSWALHFMTAWRPVWLAALLLAVIGYHARQYAQDARRLGRTSRGVLTGLRVGAVALVVLMLLEPALTMVTVEERPAVVGVLVDESASMAYPDADESALVDRTAPRSARTRPAAPRVVGTVIFPPRSDFERKSSALELFAIEAPNPRAQVGEKPTVTAPEMTRRALDFIRRSQQADGAWGDPDWPQNVGVTALACLALFAEGNLPRQGPSGRALARGLEFLLDHAKDDGQIVARDVYRYGPMYDHSWATLCLLQAYGNMPWRRDAPLLHQQAALQEALDAAVRHLDDRLDERIRPKETLAHDVLEAHRAIEQVDLTADREDLARRIAAAREKALHDFRPEVIAERVRQSALSREAQAQLLQALEQAPDPKYRMFIQAYLSSLVPPETKAQESQP